MNLQDLLQHAPYGLPQSEKEHALLPLLQDATKYHQSHCPAYQAITQLIAPQPAQSLAEILYLPVSLFKYRNLRSVSPDKIRVTLQSSGTSGQRSRIELDAETTKISSRALAASLARVTEGKRLPMLIIDTPNSIQGHDKIGARAAAILGLMPYGRDHVFALDEALQIIPERVTTFLEKYQGQNILLYGFTFLIWQALLPACRAYHYDLSRALLLHSGGWKALHQQAVDNTNFHQALHEASGLQNIRNFYGMAELPGTIFMEGEDGLLYPPNFADVIIRDPITRQPLPRGEVGLIQILDTLPRSYPGHSLLTEDMGMIVARDSGGMCGHGIKIIGRAPRAALRGCSDVLAGG